MSSLLGELPEEAKTFAGQTSATVASNPQAIYSTLIDSLHTVFWVGLAFILIGKALTLLLKNVKLIQPAKADKTSESPEPQLNHI